HARALAGKERSTVLRVRLGQPRGKRRPRSADARNAASTLGSGEIRVRVVDGDRGDRGRLLAGSDHAVAFHWGVDFDGDRLGPFRKTPRAPPRQRNGPHLRSRAVVDLAAEDDVRRWRGNAGRQHAPAYIEDDLMRGGSDDVPLVQPPVAVPLAEPRADA